MVKVIHQNQLSQNNKMFDLLIGLINSEYFGVSCVIIAALLAVFSIKEYKLSLIILFAEFALCWLASFIGLSLTKLLNPYGIYIVSAFIQILTIICFLIITMQGKKSHWLIAALVGIAAISNIIMARAYFGHDFYYSPQELFKIYPNLLGFIMIMQLTYMSLFNKALIKRLGRYGSYYTRCLDMVFMDGNLLTNRRMA